MKTGIFSKRNLLLGFILSIILLSIVSVVIFSSRIQVKRINQVTQNLILNSPAFSPEGDLIAFFQEGDVIVSDLNGTELKHFPVEQNIISNIHWLSESQIIYVGKVKDPSHNASESSQFWILDTFSKKIYPINNEWVFSGEIKYFTISPSRQYVAFLEPRQSGNDGNRYDLYVLDLENGNFQTFSSPPTLLNCNSPTWNDDNALILSACPCLAKDDSTCSSQIWLIDTQTNNSKVIEDGQMSRNLSLSPNGQWLVYLGKLDTVPPTFNYYLAPVQDGIPDFNRSYHLDFSGNFWVDAIFRQNHFELPPSYATWSPDSNHIIFSGNLRINDEFKKGIWIATLDN